MYVQVTYLTYLTSLPTYLPTYSFGEGVCFSRIIVVCVEDVIPSGMDAHARRHSLYGIDRRGMERHGCSMEGPLELGEKRGQIGPA